MVEYSRHYRWRFVLQEGKTFSQKNFSYSKTYLLQQGCPSIKKHFAFFSKFVKNLQRSDYFGCQDFFIQKNLQRSDLFGCQDFFSEKNYNDQICQGVRIFIKEITKIGSIFVNKNSNIQTNLIVVNFFTEKILTPKQIQWL